MRYRPEIDGLRAVAVLPVVLFHAGVPAFAGGFVGVDIFFVISGYLITSIIVGDLRAERFSIVRFYERRARRILPALFFVTLVSMPLAWLWMMPSQLKDYSQSLVAVASFSANIYYYLKSGYFEPSLELSPMLHMWSLAVEEQYYLVFPPLMLLMRRWKSRNVVAILCVVAAASFAAAEWMSIHHPTANYFLATGRAWELLAGALLAPNSERRWAEGPFAGVAAGLGATCLVASLLFIDRETPFPGIWALLPVGGAALVIQFASAHNWTGRLLSTRVFVLPGLISYSTYLWHQPLFAFARLRSLEGPSQVQLMLLAVLSFALGYVSWRWVETPFRRKGQFTRGQIAIFSGCGLALLAGVGSAGHLTAGFAPVKYRLQGPLASELQERLAQAAQTRKLWKELMPEATSPFGPDARRRVLVLGDSLSEDLYVALKLNQRHFEGFEFRRLTLDDLCMGRLDALDRGGAAKCARQARAVRDSPLTAQADLIVLSAGWDHRSPERVEDLLDYWGDRPVVVVGTASFADMASLLYRIASLDIPAARWSDFFAKHIHVQSRDASLELAAVARRSKVRFVDKYDVFCRGEGQGRSCQLMDEQGLPLIIDQSHVSRRGAQQIGAMVSALGWLEAPRM